MSWLKSHVTRYAVLVAALCSLVVAFADQASGVNAVQACNHGFTPMQNRIGFLIDVVTVIQWYQSAAASSHGWQSARVGGTRG